MPVDGNVRIGAIGDLHCPRFGVEEIRSLFGRIAECCDVLLLCGDITDYGKPEEAKLLVEALPALEGIPVAAVLGNHDHESGHAESLTDLFERQGMCVLDGTSVQIKGVEFVGVKGFAGGFGDRLLQSWGEPAVKRFVHESVDEALKLESALAKQAASPRVVLLHYAPIRETLVGESPEIVPFLGTSRLEEPIDRYGATAVFHGHAHHGSLEGRTKAGIPVYNVALPLLLQQTTQEPPLRVIRLPLTKTVERI
ncbi:MAG: metallophosphoesterase [Nitrospira sp. SG-bin1]|nr:MAG: metallophosphoesterase [Nitrospira sp. SG-bin1]